MKVLIADTQPTVRRALSIWINGQFDLEVIGESCDSTELMEKMNQLRPEVIILDCNLPGLETRKLVRNIRQVSEEVTIILLFNGPFDQFETDPLDVDYCASKIDPPARIIEAILKARRWNKGNIHSSHEDHPN